MNQMVQRWKMSPNQSMVTEPDGGYVEYEDHLAAIAEKNREIERLKATTIDVWVQEEDAKIKQLVRLCLSNGIISRGLACEHLGCAREDLDDVIKEDSDGRGEETA